MSRRACSILWKLALIVCEVWGLSSALEVFSGQIHWGALNYFTNLSNLLALVYFITALVVLVRRPARGPTVFPLWKGTVTMGLVVTMMVAQFMLGGSHGLTLIMMHIVCPLMVLADWLFFDEKGLVKKHYPWLWAIVPTAYLCYAMLAAWVGDGIGGHGSRYPYPFLDVDARGALAVAATVVILFALLILAGYVFYFVDHAAARHSKIKPLDNVF